MLLECHSDGLFPFEGTSWTIRYKRSFVSTTATKKSLEGQLTGHFGTTDDDKLSKELTLQSLY